MKVLKDEMKKFRIEPNELTANFKYDPKIDESDEDIYALEVKEANVLTPQNQFLKPRAFSTEEDEKLFDKALENEQYINLKS